MPFNWVLWRSPVGFIDSPRQWILVSVNTSVRRRCSPLPPVPGPSCDPLPTGHLQQPLYWLLLTSRPSALARLLSCQGFPGGVPLFSFYRGFVGPVCLSSLCATSLHLLYIYMCVCIVSISYIYNIRIYIYLIFCVPYFIRRLILCGCRALCFLWIWPDLIDPFRELSQSFWSPPGRGSSLSPRVSGATLCWVLEKVLLLFPRSQVSGMEKEKLRHIS